MVKLVQKMVIGVVILGLIISCQQRDANVRRITVKEYIDKMTAGWIGQMVGVGWSGPTEFKFKGDIIPNEQVPEWQSGMVNQHYQDDIYVEMTFLRTLELYGFDVSIRQAGIDFANSRYQLWHANKAGRDNLRSGIAPPYSGHPQYNAHADDIDYQIEADFSGLIAPGMPQVALDLGEKFGRLMNYGDGLYGGQFVAGMYAKAFFETEIEKIIRAGLECIPAGSQYHECITDVLTWYKENPNDWHKTWHLINEKYHKNPGYRKFSCSGAEADFNIDAKINGAYIVMGLLYGKGDLDSTIIISTRCGQDSDCNPSNAGGVLCTTLGYSKLPDRFKSEINRETKFSFTEYNFPGLISVCEKLVRQAVVRTGGRIEKNASGEEELVIPITEPVPGVLLQCWQPHPVEGNVHFTDEEMQKIQIRMRASEDFVSTWQVAGPYRKQNLDAVALFDVAFAPEKSATEKIQWQTMPMATDGYSPWIIQIDKFFGGENQVAYLRTKIWSDQTRQVTLELGSDDGVKVWLNNTLVHQNNVQRGHTAGEDKINVTLVQGWNTCLVKITQGGGEWQASLCICDDKGNVLKDLQFKAD